MQFKPKDLAEMIDIPATQIKASNNNEHKWPELSYEILSGEEQQNCYELAYKTLSSKDLRVCDKSSREVWEKGWGEVLENIRDKGFNPEHLTPQYFHHNILRLNGNYIATNDSNFEENLYTEIKRLIFKTYFDKCENAVEFGSGTGKSLLLLAEMYPQLKITGCDWSGPAVEIANTIAKETGYKINGNLFNLFTLEGSEKIAINSQTGVYTFHTLEQIGSEYGAFLEWLIQKKPGICVHLEPIKEFYDPGSEFDDVAIKYHERRNYLDGFYTELKKLEIKGRIKIHKARRLKFGSMFQEAYSLIIWSPTT